MLTVLERFMDKTQFNHETGCWDWIGAVSSSRGYGSFRFQGVLMNASRASYHLFKMDPKEKHVLHTCHRKICVNSEHLRTGTNRKNCREAAEEGAYPGTMTPERVLEIRAAKGSNSVLGKKYGIHPSQVSRIKTGRRWGYIKE